MRERWGKENIARLAREADFNRSNVYAWQDGADVEPGTVSDTARALGANPIDAYIAAGYFTSEDFDEYRSRGAELAVPNQVLADEVLRRMNLCRPDAAASGGGPEVTHLPLTQGAEADVAEPVEQERLQGDRDGQ